MAPNAETCCCSTGCDKPHVWWRNLAKNTTAAESRWSFLGWNICFWLGGDENILSPTNKKLPWSQNGFQRNVDSLNMKENSNETFGSIAFSVYKIRKPFQWGTCVIFFLLYKRRILWTLVLKGFHWHKMAMDIWPLFSKLCWKQKQT